MDQAEAVRALVRDEGRLRHTLELHKERLYDQRSASDLRDRLEDTLDSIRAIALNTDLWFPLETDAASQGAPKAIEELAEIAWLGLPPLFEAAGYRSPPPPSATELVDDTVAALAAAANVGPSEAPDVIERVRQRLIRMRLRVLRDLDHAPPVARDSLLRRAAQTTGNIARGLLPVAVAGAVGVAAESLLPGSGVGLLAGKWTIKVAEKGTELAVAHVVGGGVPVRNDDDLPEVISTEVDQRYHLTPGKLHLAALQDALQSARVFGSNSPHDLRLALVRARRHYDRLAESSDRPGNWCDGNEVLGTEIDRLERLAASPQPCAAIGQVLTDAEAVAFGLV